jgi:gamma-tubulin complex component 2
LPAALQEQLVLDDLLSSYMGLEGKYIKMVPRAASSAGTGPLGGLGDAAFVLETGTMDRSLASLAERMLPMSGALVAVKAFVEAKSRHEHGLVAHALAAAVKVLVKEYLVLVAQLEHQHRLERLTLQKLWFFVQPALHTMLVLRDVCATAGTFSGGALLNVLYAQADRGGDEKGSELHAFLLARAAAPYLDMLRRWVYEGVLDDPYHEFMVAEDETVTKETVAEDFTTAYWGRRYTLRRRHVAVFLCRFEDKVLTTGKYLNVVRECGRDVRCPDADAAFGASGAIRGGDHGVLLGEAAYGEVVERAFAFASSTLLELLMGERQLVARLRSMKHYFLLDQGDLYVNFMDLAEDELRQDIRLVSKTRIEALLQLAVQSSVANRDSFKDDLTCAFAPFSMFQHLEAIHSKDGNLAAMQAATPKASSAPGATLKGIEVFMLDYRVSWPVSLVVSKRSVTKYQLVFRHLFFARHVERCLKATWQGHQHLKELDVRAAGGRSYCLRHRMLGFMQNIVYYFTYEVIEPRWHEMEQRLKECGTMDEVLAAHAELQDTILKECLLTNQELLKILIKIMTICLLFAEQVRLRWGGVPPRVSAFSCAPGLTWLEPCVCLRFR